VLFCFALYSPPAGGLPASLADEAGQPRRLGGNDGYIQSTTM